jgi:hypothetical protein
MTHLLLCILQDVAAREIAECPAGFEGGAGYAAAAPGTDFARKFRV